MAATANHNNANDITTVISALASRQAGRPKGKPLSGPKRAAILMLALGEQYGGKVWALLDDDEVRELSIHMSTLGTVEADVVEDLLLEFVSRMSASGALMGTFDATERLLQQYLPSDRVTGIMDEIRGPAGRNMWEKLSNVQEEVLANYLKNEYPQTIAVVLSKLKPEHAARVLAILPEDLALDVVGRMLKMEAVQKEVIERVEQTLRTEFMSNLSQTRRRDAHEVMAEIFNNFDRQTETRFITSLEEENRESAERIKALMFTFDDLIKLDSASAQTLMRNVDKDKLGIALKSANEEVRSLLPRQHVVARRQDADGRHGGDGTGAAARRRRGAGAARQPRQGHGRQGRNHADQEPRRRRAGVLMAAPAKFLFDTDFAAPDKTRERAATRRRDRAEGRGRRGTRLPRRLRGGPARGQGGKRPPRGAGAGGDRHRHPRHRHALLRHRGQDGNRGRRCRGRGGAQAVQRTDRPRAARRDHRRWSATASRIWSRPRISWSASTTSSTRPPASKIERQATQSGFEGRLVILAEPGHRHRRLPDRMGRRRRGAGTRGHRSEDQRTRRALSGVPRSGRNVRP